MKLNITLEWLKEKLINLFVLIKKVIKDYAKFVKNDLKNVMSKQKTMIALIEHIEVPRVKNVS